MLRTQIEYVECVREVCGRQMVQLDTMCRDPEYITDQWKDMVSDAIAKYILNLTVLKNTYF